MVLIKCSKADVESPQLDRRLTCGSEIKHARNIIVSPERAARVGIETDEQD